MWVSDAPLVSSLKELGLPGSSFSDEDAPRLLSVIGASLECVSLENSYSSGGVVEEVVLKCPSLKPLRIDTGSEVLTKALLERVSSRTASALEQSLSVVWEQVLRASFLKAMPSRKSSICPTLERESSRADTCRLSRL